MRNRLDEEIVEPEEVPAENYNPLDEAVNDKPYTIPNVNTSGVNMNAPIEEPTFAPPPIQPKKPVVDEKPPKPEPVNPEMRHLGKKDTEMAASHMAKMIIQGYEWMHTLANKGLKVSEKKLHKLQADGEINLNAMIDYDYGKKIRAGDFFQDYNAQVENLLTVSDEFKEEVTPILEKVLAKRGIGMTDEQMLMFLFGKDIAAKSMIFFQQKTQLNLMISSIKEATTGAYAQAAPQKQQSAAPQKSSAPAAEAVATEPEEVEMVQRRNKKRERGRPKEN